MKFKAGDGVIVLTEYGYLGHGFPQGSYGEIVRFDGKDGRGVPIYEVTVAGIEYTQAIPEVELALYTETLDDHIDSTVYALSLDVPEGTINIEPFDTTEEKTMSKNAGEGEIKAKAVRYVSVLSDEQGAFMSTNDRDHARKVKKEFGGKKNGVKITAYAPVKEIR